MDGPNQGPDQGVLYFGGKEREEAGLKEECGVDRGRWTTEIEELKLGAQVGGCS